MEKLTTQKLMDFWLKLNRNFLNVHLFLVAISKRIPQATGIITPQQEKN